jgi:hypothetical protein
MTFAEREKREWHAARRRGLENGSHEVSVSRAHCGAPAPTFELSSEFPLCAACDS